MPIRSQSGCDRSGRSRFRRPALVVGAVLVLAAVAKAGDFAIEASVIAAGGGHSSSAGGCLTVDASIGHDTTGLSEGGSFSMRSGFWPALGDRPTDSLFNNGFQECT
jgi:hypothetical protein